MSNVRINTKDLIKDNNQQANKTVNAKIPNIQRALNQQIEKIVFQRLVAGLPTIQGTDLAEIGVPDINTRLTGIVQTIARNVRVKIIPGRNLAINITILERDYSDVLSLPDAVYAYTSANGGGVLEWLKWILLGGSGQIIGGFEFSPLASPFSRTGARIVTGKQSTSE